MGSLQVPHVAIFTHKHPNLGGGVCHAGVAIPYTCSYPNLCLSIHTRPSLKQHAMLVSNAWLAFKD